MSSAAARSAVAPFPERIDRYELLLPIASGGMATVYLARVRGVRGFERELAVKLMHPHLREGAELEGAAIDLVEEAKLTARIRDPNVVAVVDVGEDPHGIFLVMDYVEGDSLGALLRHASSARERLPPPIALRILCDALSGLHAAHELRDASGAALELVHRDFSPQNILVGVDGISRLTDFGIAKAASREGLTSTGIVKGKVGYMSPEQARGQRLDRRCDVWAAGVVAWEAFSGERLYGGRDAVATALEIVTKRPRALRSVRPELPAAVEDAIGRALTPELENRCPTAEKVRELLLDAWGGAIADAREVAEHVRRVAGDKLDARRREAEEIGRLREATSDGSGPRRAALPQLASPTEPLAGPAGRSDPPRARRGRVYLLLGAACVVAAAGAALRWKQPADTAVAGESPASAQREDRVRTEAPPEPTATAEAVPEGAPVASPSGGAAAGASATRADTRPAASARPHVQPRTPPDAKQPALPAASAKLLAPSPYEK